MTLGPSHQLRNSAVTAEEADDGHDPDLHEFDDSGDADLYFDDRNRA